MGEISENFSKKNNKSGAILSFLGKVRETRDNKQIKNIQIEFYEKMAKIQTDKIIKQTIKKFQIDDFLIIHRFGRLLPGENIIFIISASKHRKESFFFVQNLIEWFKFKITFWKKEYYSNHSSWVKSEDV